MTENSSDFGIKVKVDPGEAVNGLEQVHGALEGIESLIAKIGLSIGLAELGHKAFELAETYENVQNRLRAVVKDEEDLTNTTHELFLVSEQTRSSFEGTAGIYTKLTRAAQGLNIPQHDLLEVTRSLNEAAVISGKSTESLSGVVGQLAIGLQTGTLNGRALRLILRDFPDIAQALEKQLGVTSQEFKKLGAEGKISAQDLLQGLVGARTELDEKFGKVVPTVASQMEVFTTKLTEFVGQANEAMHVTGGLSAAIGFLGDHIPVVVGVTGTLAVVLGIELAAKAIPAVVAGLGTLDVALVATLAPLAAVGGAALAVGLKVGELADDIKNAYDDVGGLKQLTDFGQDGANIELLKHKIKNLQEVIAHNPDNEIAKRNLEGYREDLERMTDEHKKVAEAAKASAKTQVDASANVITDLEHQLELLQLNTREREIATKEYELEKAAQAATGAAFTNSQRDEVTARLDKIRTLTEEGKILDELRGPQEAYERRVEQANDLLSQGKISQEEFNQLFKDRQVLYEAAASAPKQGDPFTVEKNTGLDKYLEGLERERDLFGLTNEQREVTLGLDKARAAAGRDLTASETARITNEIQQNKELEDSIRIRAAAEGEAGKLQQQILLELRGPEEELLGIHTQLNVLFHDGAISVEEYNRALEKLNITAHQTDTSLKGGVSTGLSQIQLQLDDLSKIGNKTVTDAFNGANDALVNFVKTGKLSFSSLVDSIQEDLARLLVQQAEQSLFGNLFGKLSGSGSSGSPGILGGLFGAASGGGGLDFSSQGLSNFFSFFADGGDAPADKPIIVGENGPEILKLKHPGTVIPNGQTRQLLQGGGGNQKPPDVNVAPPQVHVSVTNQLDSTAVVQNGLSTRAGEQAVLNIIARNRAAVRSNLA